jgi:membrane protein DedA with SNARE-associated domain
MHISLNDITGWLIQFGYLAIIPFIMIEGPIVTVICGSLCSFGIFNFFYVYLVIIAADIIADCAYYAIGRLGNEKFLDKYGRFIGINPARALKLKNHFDSQGAQTLFLGKISHGIGGVFLIAAGLARMPFSKFVLYNTYATLIKSLALLLIGYFFGQALLKINSFLQFFTAASICLLIIAVVVFFSYRLNKKNIRNAK